jgi:lipopolysaccharide biosynthesis protein
VKRVRTVAFYLPQFHRIPENDAWWGPGFTEWRKVTAARPLYVGHAQPHLPADLGFYDLRVAEARQEQADLARAHGVDAFCYWHYWFHGRRLLERPFDEVLGSGHPDLPFCLCWANENWTRRWDGHDEELLIAQGYSADDDRRHLAHLASAFRDPRYLRSDGRPVLLVYRACRLPDAAATCARFREEARRLGIGELYLCRVESFPDERGDPARLGFDAAVEFQPDWSLLTKDLCTGPLRLLDGEGEITGLAAASPGPEIFGVYRYDKVVERMLGKPPASYRRHPCVAPMWDNSPRRGTIARSVVFHGSTPELYEGWLRTAVAREQAAGGEPLVFINAWNEWAEGNHLEPDLRHGRGYLEATRRAVSPPG